MLRMTEAEYAEYLRRNAAPACETAPPSAEREPAKGVVATGPENRSAARFVLPWPPSTNTIWRSMRSGPMAGRVLLSREGRAFFAEAERAVQVQRAGRAIAGRVEVEIVLHAPTRAALDIDNRAKAVLDACTKGGLWVDDSQVDVLIVRRACVLKGGAVVVRAVEIEAVPEQPALPIPVLETEDLWD